MRSICNLVMCDMPKDTDRYPAINPSGLESERKPPLPPEVGAPKTTPEPAAVREVQKAQEELSVEKLKAELFDREVPEEYKQLIAAAGRGEYFVPNPDVYANHFAAEVLKKSVYPYPMAEMPDRIMDTDLTEFGNLVKERFRGKTIVDLGAGRAYEIPVLAGLFEAKRYVGVDAFRPGDYVWRSQNERYTLRDDMLSFVSKIKSGVGNLMYYIGGIEVRGGVPDEVIKYCEALMREVTRTTKQGDALILGPGTIAPFEPAKFGFKMIHGFEVAEGQIEARGICSVWEKE